MEETQGKSLDAALELLWPRFRPQMLERVAVLEAAAASTQTGTLTESQSQSAHEAAHKLAGSLGTFGLTQGTVLARELELMYSPDNQLAPEQAPQLASLAAELRVLVENR